MDNPAELQINKRECFRVVSGVRHGNPTVCVQRWKPDASGDLRPVGAGFEFGIKHLDGVIELLQSFAGKAGAI